MAKAPSRIAAASPESQPAAAYTPPANPEAEQSVLGAILVRPEVMDRVADLLTPKDFYRQAHSRIYQAILDLYNRHEPVDLVSVTALLKERGHLEGVGGPGFLAGLSSQVGFAVNADYYARLVHDKAMLRRLQGAAQEVSRACQGHVENTQRFLEAAETRILGVTQSYNGGSPGWGRIISSQVLLTRKYSIEDQIIAKGILPKGASLLLSAESGDGKSLMRTQIGICLVMGWEIWGLQVPTARRVFIFTFETPESSEAERLKSMLEGLKISNFPADRLSFSDPTVRLDFHGQEADQWRAIQIIRESGAAVVVYDPLSSIHGANENDNIQMRRVMDTITQISRKTGTTPIAIHHFGKPTEGTPTQHRFRGASSIRDWADTAITVTRRKHEHKILRLLEFAKVRSGPEPKPILLERDEFFLHHKTDEDNLCPPEKVQEILLTLGGQVEGQGPLKEAIIEATGCCDRRARDFINLALERQAIRQEPHPTDGRKKIYSADGNGN